MSRPNGFAVMSRRCQTCIYRKDWMGTPLVELERQVKDKWIGFKGYRVCHCQKRGGKACCRGFWDHHKDEFQVGQIAQRLDMVVFVDPLIA